MRRVKIMSAKPGNSPAEDLRLKYQSFKKENPSAQARVPREIKLLAQSIMESGATVTSISKEIGLSPTALRSWLKAMDRKAPRREKKTKIRRSTGHEQNTSNGELDVDVSEVKRELIRLSANVTHPNGEGQVRLAALTRRLIESGIGVERIAALVGVHPLTVRSWLKTSQATSAVVEPKKAAAAPAERPHQKPLEPLVSKAPRAKTSKMAAVTGSLPIPPASSLEGPFYPGHWVRIRVDGHMLEIDWRDLVQKLPAVDRTEAAAEAELTKPSDGSMDFNLAVTQDHDFIRVIDQFEKSVIKSAMKRHRSIAKCCEALKLPRSTFDAKRRKHGLT